MSRGKKPTRPETGLTPDEREQLAREHRPLVVRWCQRLVRKAPKGMDSEEVMGYAMRGLAHALEKFDPTRGVSFGAFAGPWVRGAILRGFRREIESLPWRGQIPEVDSRKNLSAMNSIAAPVTAKGPTVLLAAIVVDDIAPRLLENQVLAIEALAPTRLAIVTGAEALELLALPDTRRLQGMS